jgi:hypothetical protein
MDWAGWVSFSVVAILTAIKIAAQTAGLIRLDPASPCSTRPTADLVRRSACCMLRKTG